MTDDEIIRAYWQREERAIRGSEERYGRYCFSIAQSILQNRQDAEECVSDTWLRAWQAIPPQRPEVLRLFFAKLVRNLALNRYKANNAAKRGGGEVPLLLEELSECLGGGEGPESRCLAGELEQAVNAFARALPERERGIFLRRYFYAEPIPDIARRYRLTPHHITVLLSRTRQKLRRRLEQEELL